MADRLIRADALEHEMWRRCGATDIESDKGRAKWDSGLWIRYKVFTECIADAPTIEAEPIVRCKDCKYFDEMEDTEQPGYRECHYFSNWVNAYYMLPDDGCTCGERKEVEENDRT